MHDIRPFRFGIQHDDAASAAAWREAGHRAEGLGYDVLVTADHISQGGLAFAPALMAVADATTSLRIGTLVLDNDFRHPALVAAEAATLDVLSDGRFELGIGAGWDRADYEVSGIPFDAPGIRVSRLQESITILKRAFGDDPVRLAGRHYTVHGLQTAPRPVQRPHPPILVGGGGRRILGLAAREADIVSIMPPGVGSGTMPDLRAEALDRAVERVRGVAGDRLSHIELSTLLQRFVVTDEVQHAAETLARQWQVTPADAVASPWALIGSIDRMVDTLRERRERWGVSYWVVHGRHMDAFAPIVARLAGS